MDIEKIIITFKRWMIFSSPYHYFLGGGGGYARMSINIWSFKWCDQLGGRGGI